MRVPAFVVLALAVGCASAPIKKQDLPPLAQADALVLDGCYDCLLEARSLYQRVAVGKARPLLVAKLFETQLLIALREKELAIESGPAVERARDLAREMPAAAEAARYLAIVDAVVPDFVGTPRVEMKQLRRDREPFVSGLDAELAWLRTGTALREPVRQYLSLALDCANMGREPRVRNPSVYYDDAWTGSLKARDMKDAPSLVAYRVAICDSPSRSALERIRTAVPRFVETAYFLARVQVVSAMAMSDAGLLLNLAEAGASAQVLLAEARKRFPNSASTTYIGGTYDQFVGDCAAAIGDYDEMLALKPLHEDALLGRTACLSYLRRHTDAIAAATHMIDLQTDNWGRAYYWRAWNRYNRQELGPARADIDRAKTLAPDDQTFTLAGIIEYDQDALGLAEPDLKRGKALTRGNRNCTAMWYLALVKIKQELWLDSSATFEDSMGCYEANARDDESRRQTMEGRTDLEAAYRARQIAAYEAALAEDRSQQFAAAFNAANQSAHGGKIDKAKALLDVAAKDPKLAGKVAELRELLK